MHPAGKNYVPQVDRQHFLIFTLQIPTTAPVEHHHKMIRKVMRKLSFIAPNFSLVHIDTASTSMYDPSDVPTESEAQ